MKIIYAQEAIPNQLSKSIFLAGPSLRPGQDGISWRIKAIEILEMLEYDGIVFVPEFRDGIFDDNFNWDNQVMWEDKCLKIADNILFNINRNIDNNLLGLTTNTEFGQWMDSGKIVLVTPLDADKVEYQKDKAKQFKIPTYQDLFNGFKYIIGEQTHENRIDGERFIPQEIWKLKQFQSWYKSMKFVGNWISDAKVLNTYRIPSNNKIFAFSLWVNIYIKKENRYKNNEFIFSRPDISSCVLYKPDFENPLNSDVIFVSEFRSPASNSQGMIYELPGGSSVKENVDPKQRIIEELEEETGFKPNIHKLQFEGAKQIYGTLVTCKSHLYSYELSTIEYHKIEDSIKNGETFGVIEDTELTYLHTFKIRDLLDNDIDYIDWANIGQVLKVINKI